MTASDSHALLGAIQPAYNRTHPFLARLTERRLLSCTGSQKNVWHVRVDFSGSGLRFSCGDSLGVYVQNAPEAVAGLLRAAGLTGSETVTLGHNPQTTSLKEALTHHLSLQQPTASFLRLLEAHVQNSGEAAQLAAHLGADPQQLTDYLNGCDYQDLLEQYPSSRLEAQQLCEALRRLVPRLYSIASSPLVNDQAVDLTVACVRYQAGGRERRGVASSYLTERCTLGQAELPVFIAPSHFRLPEDDRPIIMVGPGTGVAPFRAFLQEREARKATGKNWLFFGDQHAKTDFLYRVEWEAWQARGLLSRLDVAFSRDQPHKIYVQDRMLQAAPELWQWVESGATIYVCGDAKRMAPDVQQALLDIFRQEGGMDAAAAQEYLKVLKKSQRYQKDVY